VSFNAALNAANGGFAVASSPLTYLSGTPDNAIDHNDATVLHTNYLATEARIVDIDLQSSRHITSVRVLDAHSDGHSWKESLFFSDDGVTWTEAWSQTHSSASMHDTGIVALTTPGTARYWRFEGPMLSTGAGEQCYLGSLELWSDDATPGTGGTGGSTGTGGPAYSGDLQAWLADDDTNLHKTDGLPWLTRTLLQSTYDLVSTIRDRVYPGAGPLTVLTDLYLNTIKTQLDAQEALDALVSARLTGASGGGGSAFYGPDGTQVAAGVEALLARSTNAQVGFPAAPWEMTAETDWDDAIAWDQPADLYVVTFTSTPPTIPDNGRAGVPVRYRLAWWTPLNGTFAQERRWIDFENAHLVDPAGRMPGLLLQTYTSGGGHLQAWTLNV